MPRVSVITSTFDRPDRLKRAIASVVEQTFEDWELIVVHDGFSDLRATPDEADPRIRQLGMEHFGNDTRPKNRGIVESDGEYIAFLDDDNEWRPDHLQALVKCLDENPDIALAYGDRWLVDETAHVKAMRGICSDFDPFQLLRKNYIDTSDVLVRRATLFAVGGFDENYRKYIDWNLWCRLAKAGYRFKHVPLILTDYHIHLDSKSVRPEDELSPMTPAWNPFDCEIQVPFLGTVEPPRVAIFSLTYDRLDYTKKCFESLYKTAGYDFDHYIVDNGSTDGTVEWLNQLSGPDKIVFLNPSNKGISAASNQALTAMGDRYDIIVKVDNDCLFLTDGWLAKMVEIWKANRMFIMSPYVQGLRDNPGGAPRHGWGEVKGEQLGLTKHVGGICVFADARAYKDFRWDEDSFLHGMQDVEFSQHALSQGFQPAYLENFFVEHYEGTAGQEKRYPEYFERRRLEKRTRYATSQGH